MTRCCFFQFAARRPTLVIATPANCYSISKIALSVLIYTLSNCHINEGFFPNCCFFRETHRVIAKATSAASVADLSTSFQICGAAARHASTGARRRRAGRAAFISIRATSHRRPASALDIGRAALRSDTHGGITMAVATAAISTACGRAAARRQSSCGRRSRLASQSPSRSRPTLRPIVN